MPIPPEIVFMPGGTRTEIHLDGSDTGGAFCLLLAAGEAGASPEAEADRAATAAAAVRHGWRFAD
jgi:hypothetical protein